MAVAEERWVHELPALEEWRCGGVRRDGRRCTTLMMLVSVDFRGRLERECDSCGEWRVKVQ